MQTLLIIDRVGADRKEADKLAKARGFFTCTGFTVKQGYVEYEYEKDQFRNQNAKPNGTL